MKEVTINGVSYLPASALAKQFRYTTDYIGQLCRAKKVDAQLVGRSWYVNPLSLEAHKSTKYSKSTSAEKTIDSNYKVEISRIDVQSTLNKNTVKATNAAPQNFAKRIEWKPSKYEEDEGDLFPVVKRETKPTRVHVGLADSTPVSIKTTAKAIDLIAEELPMVSLKGKVSVSSLEEDFEELTEEILRREVPLEATYEPPSIQNSLTKPSKRPVRKQFHNSAPVRTAADTVVSAETTEVFIESDTASYRAVKIAYTVASGALAVILLLVIFAESQIRADALTQESGLEFSTAAFSALVSNFLD